MERPYKGFCAALTELCDSKTPLRQSFDCDDVVHQFEKLYKYK